MSLRIGFVGAGFVARRRAAAIAADPRASLVAVAAHSLGEATDFCQGYNAEPLADWGELVEHPAVDLVCVCHPNSGHGPVVRGALLARKHVVVEYPLSLDLGEAEALAALARQQQCLLHVEHIELLGGLHRAAAAHLGAVGHPRYVRWSTLKPKHPAPDHWTYRPSEFGFPLMGAQARLHRLTQLLGPVQRISCQLSYDHQPVPPTPQRYRTCLCTAQLWFTQDTLAEVTYGKGEGLWMEQRQLDIHGPQGSLLLAHSHGELLTATGNHRIAIGHRRGLFGQDMEQVIAHLTEGTPLYSRLQDSLYSLKVAAAAQAAALSGKTLDLNPGDDPPGSPASSA